MSDLCGRFDSVPGTYARNDKLEDRYLNQIWYTCEISDPFHQK